MACNQVELEMKVERRCRLVWLVSKSKWILLAWVLLRNGFVPLFFALMANQFRIENLT